jgi:hypothetical protein
MPHLARYDVQKWHLKSVTVELQVVQSLLCTGTHVHRYRQTDRHTDTHTHIYMHARTHRFKASLEKTSYIQLTAKTLLT